MEQQQHFRRTGRSVETNNFVGASRWQHQEQQSTAESSSGCWYPPQSYASNAAVYYTWGPAMLYSAYPVAYASDATGAATMPLYYASPTAFYHQSGSSNAYGDPYMQHAAQSAAMGPSRHGSSSSRLASFTAPHSASRGRRATRTASRRAAPSVVVQELCDEDVSSDVAASTSDQVVDSATSWGSLTAAILASLLSRLGENEVKHLRLVCRHWQSVVDHDLESLSPNTMLSRTLVQRFPNLKVLHLTSCENIRNRDLLIISRSGLHLHTLTLGDDACKPWVTNSGLEHIAQITSLTSLNLHECKNVTNNGLLALTSLRGLASLSLKGCGKLTNAGLEALQRHTLLTSLNLYGCMRIADKGLLALTQLHLVSLHLGNTRVKDEGLSYLAQITTLQELHFDTEELTDVGVAQLTSLTNLQSLALRDCGEVSGDSLSVLVPALPNLISLDLYKNITMDDSQVGRPLEFRGSCCPALKRCRGQPRMQSI